MRLQEKEHDKAGSRMSENSTVTGERGTTLDELLKNFDEEGVKAKEATR